MSANAIGGDWVAAYLDWTQWDSADEQALPPSAPAGERFDQTPDCSCEEAASAYLEWSVAAPPPAGSEAAARRSDAATLDSLRESMLLTALQTEADYLHILRGVMDAGEPAVPARKLIVNALAQAEKLLDDERKAWCTLLEFRGGERPEPRAESGRDFPRDWPLALEGVAADVRALAGIVLELQVH